MSFCEAVDQYRVLHVCGGDPGPADIIRHELVCSPRMWR